VAATEAAAREARRVAGSLVTAVEQLTTRDRDDLSRIEEQAVLFGLELAEQVIGRELQTCGDALLLTITRAMGLVPDRGATELRVHPLDAEAARGVIELRTELAGRVEVIADSLVDAGGCIAVVGPLRIDTQMTQVIERVRNAARP
jgi:flagellar biosynthesis/type III secretory pathway protein FliH